MRPDKDSESNAHGENHGKVSVSVRILAQIGSTFATQACANLPRMSFGDNQHGLARENTKPAQGAQNLREGAEGTAAARKEC
eukprot:8963840-Pyramimonas_sp.AAC.1